MKPYAIKDADEFFTNSLSRKTIITLEEMGFVLGKDNNFYIFAQKNLTHSRFYFLFFLGKDVNSLSINLINNHKDMKLSSQIILPQTVNIYDAIDNYLTYFTELLLMKKYICTFKYSTVSCNELVAIRTNYSSPLISISKENGLRISEAL